MHNNNINNIMCRREGEITIKIKKKTGLIACVFFYNYFTIRRLQRKILILCLIQSRDNELYHHLQHLNRHEQHDIYYIGIRYNKTAIILFPTFCRYKSFCIQVYTHSVYVNQWLLILLFYTNQIFVVYFKINLFSLY